MELAESRFVTDGRVSKIFMKIWPLHISRGYQLKEKTLTATMSLKIAYGYRLKNRPKTNGTQGGLLKMQTAIISAGVGTLLFLCLYLGFRTGLRLGMQTAKGQIPPKIRNPVEAVKEKVAEAKQEKAVTELLDGHARMMAYDGFLPHERR
jgi:hypothetical protein